MGDIEEEKPLLSPQSSLAAEASQTSHHADDMDDVGPLEGSGLPAEPGTIRTDPMSLLKKDGSKLRPFRGKMQTSKLLDKRLQQAARAAEERAAEEEEARRLAAASAAEGAGGAAFGGRSRSRKRSVSKRTRRKGVAKKQKSKKNKRQSRRKVHRASSRKGRK